MSLCLLHREHGEEKCVQAAANARASGMDQFTLKEFAMQREQLCSRFTPPGTQRSSLSLPMEEGSWVQPQLGAFTPCHGPPGATTFMATNWGSEEWPPEGLADPSTSAVLLCFSSALCVSKGFSPKSARLISKRSLNLLVSIDLIFKPCRQQFLNRYLI